MDLSPDIKKVTVQPNAIYFQSEDSSKSFVLIRNGLTALQNDGRPPAQFDEEFYQRIQGFLAQNFEDRRIVRDPTEFRVGPLPELKLEREAEPEPNAGNTGLLGWIRSSFVRSAPKTVEPIAQATESIAQGVSAAASAVTNTIASTVQGVSMGTFGQSASAPVSAPNLTFLNNVQTNLTPNYKQPEYRIVDVPVKYINSNQNLGACSTMRRSRRAALLDPVKLAEIRAKDTERKRRSRECRRSRGMYPW